MNLRQALEQLEEVIPKVEKVWWFPNNFSEPVEVEIFRFDVRIFLRLDALPYLAGREIHFTYPSREAAINGTMYHCVEREVFFRKRYYELANLC